MAQARGGLMSITGTARGRPGQGRRARLRPGVRAVHRAGGHRRAARARPHRVGQYIDVSLLESGVSFAVWEAGKYFATGEVGRPLGSAHQSSAPYQALRSADGYVTVGAVSAKTWAGLAEALEMPELLADPRWSDAFARHAHREELIGTLEEVTTTRSTDDLVAALEAAGVPCAPIADYSEVFTSEHLNEREYFWDAPHPVMGAGAPARVADALLAHAGGAAGRRPPARRGHPGGAARGRLLRPEAIDELTRHPARPRSRRGKPTPRSPPRPPPAPPERTLR